MLVNRNNAHTGGFLSSNQGLLQGCGGCSCQAHAVTQPASTACGIVQGHGIVGQAGGALGADGKPLYPNAQGNFPTARNQASAARRGVRSFLAGVAGRQSGGGYGMTPAGAGQAAHGGMGYGRTPSTQYRNCGLHPAFKHGAGSVHTLGQKGGASLVDKLNQTGAVGYAYLPRDAKYNAQVAGSGYPVMTATTRRQCVGGGRRRRKKGRKRRRTRRRRGGSVFRGLGWDIEHANLRMLPSSAGPGFTGQSAGRRRRRKKGRKRRRTRRKRGGSVFRGLGWDIEHANLRMLPSSAGPGFTGQSAGRRRRKRKRTRRRSGRKRTARRKRRRRRRRTQRGGYHQYQSNVPLARTMVTPNGPAGGSWPGQLAQPPTYKIIDTCVDNYNHFTGKGHPTGVYDAAAPPVPFGGAGGKR